MWIDISNRQLDQDFEDTETFIRFYMPFHQHYMQSFIGFVLRFNLDFLSVLIIGDECRGIEDKCALNRAANLLPRVLFIVELESHHKNDHLVNVYTHMSCLFQSLQIV